MNAINLSPILRLGLLLFVTSIQNAQAVDLRLERTENSDSLLVRLVGGEADAPEEWICETSTDLKSWSVAGLRAVDEGWIFDPAKDHQVAFFRARQASSDSQSAGLYDLSSYRKFELEFLETDWLTQMTANYGTETNITASLKVDGTLLEGVGVRFKGDTSFRRATTLKKSFNIEIDASDPDLRLLGYKTLNLNNAFTDPWLRNCFSVKTRINSARE